MKHPTRGSSLARGARLLIATGVVAASSLGIGPSAAWAAQGDLDPGFGAGGKVTTDFGGGDSVNGLVVQLDRKIVAVGAGGPSGGHNFALARYNPDGTLDTSFDLDGKVTTDFGGDDEAMAAAVQDDGRIVVVGKGNGDFALARYNGDGSLDATFGAGGKVTTDLGGADIAAGVAVLPSGKILVVGQAHGGGAGDFAVVRYNANGSLDATFGAGGKVTTDFGADDSATKLVLPGGGKIVALGGTGVTGVNQNNFALARYNADGSLDATFGVGGKVTHDLGGNDNPRDIALQVDGKIVVGGETGPLSNSDFVVVRYNANGSLDTTFGPTSPMPGTVKTDFGANDPGHALAIQPNGKIVMAGYTIPLGSAVGADVVLARYNADGSLDTTFDGDGKVKSDLGGSDVALAMAQGDGKVIAAGYSNSDFLLARYVGELTVQATVVGGTLSGGELTLRDFPPVDLQDPQPVTTTWSIAPIKDARGGPARGYSLSLNLSQFVDRAGHPMGAESVRVVPPPISSSCSGLVVPGLDVRLDGHTTSLVAAPTGNGAGPCSFTDLNVELRIPADTYPGVYSANAIVSLNSGPQ